MGDHDGPEPSLGQRESGTARLDEAVTAYREALKEYSRERTPLHWAQTQNNLGTALSTLGQRQKRWDMVCEALGAAISAWEIVAPSAPAYRAPIARSVARAASLLTDNSDSPEARNCSSKFASELNRIHVTD